MDSTQFQRIDDRRLYTLLRTLSMIAGGLLGAVGILNFVLHNYDSERDAVLNFYYILFGLLIILVECQINWLVSQMVFMRTYIGKGIFYCFIATLVWDTSAIYMIAYAIALFAFGGVHLLLALTVSLFIKCKKYIKEENSNQDSNQNQDKSQNSAAKYQEKPATPSEIPGQQSSLQNQNNQEIIIQDPPQLQSLSQIALKLFQVNLYIIFLLSLLALSLNFISI